jgi:hypothetical protein
VDDRFRRGCGPDRRKKSWHRQTSAKLRSTRRTSRLTAPSTARLRATVRGDRTDDDGDDVEGHVFVDSPAASD